MIMTSSGESVQNGNKGFTLIEVLVAMALLSVAIVPLITSYVVSWRSSQDAHRRSRAVMLAQWKMEQLRAIEGYDVEDEDRSGCSLKSEADEDIFDCRVRTESIGAFENTKQVTVSVIYSSPFGGESDVKITSTFSCHDPGSC